MGFFKRLCIYTGIILLCMSIYKDLSNDTSSNDEQASTNITDNAANSSIIKMKVQPGDTVLSITEEINHSLDDRLNIEQILTDFKQYNPDTDPTDLQVNHYYYFLQYNI